MRKWILIFGLVLCSHAVSADIICKGEIMRPKVNGRDMTSTGYSLVVKIQGLDISDAYKSSMKSFDYGTVTLTETIYESRKSPIGLRPAAVHHAEVTGNLMGLNFAGFAPYLGHRVGVEYRPEPVILNSYATMFYSNLDFRFAQKENGRYDQNYRTANLQCD